MPPKPRKKNPKVQEWFGHGSIARATGNFQQMASDLNQPGGGGYSYSVRTGRTPRTGWLVAKAGHEKQIGLPASPDAIQRYHEKHGKALQKQGYSGGWAPGAVRGGKGVLDASRRYSSSTAGFQSAVGAMHTEKQDAIYNPAFGREYHNLQKKGIPLFGSHETPEGQENQAVHMLHAQQTLKRKFPGKYSDADFPAP